MGALKTRQVRPKKTNQQPGESIPTPADRPADPRRHAIAQALAKLLLADYLRRHEHDGNADQRREGGPHDGADSR